MAIVAAALMPGDALWAQERAGPPAAVVPALAPIPLDPEASRASALEGGAPVEVGRVPEPSAGDDSGSVAAGELAPAAIRAVATYEEMPDDRVVVLRGDQSVGVTLNYRWIQTRGTRVDLDDPEGPVARFVIPDGPETLEFLLVVGGPSGIDTARVAVPLAGPQPPVAGLRADAGDDQVGTVGRQVTLNGIRSVPRDGVGYRWIQVGGPPVGLKIEDRYIYTFVPQEPGVYRFALVVASGDVISQPDFVDVAVLATDPTASLGGGQPTLSTPELARQALVRLDGGLPTASLLSEAFGGIAERIDLYATYSELTAELSHRLNEVVPRAPEQRAAWTQNLFNPLTVRLIERLRPTGLDLLQAGATELPLGVAQREVLARELRLMASGFRSLEPGP